MNFNRLLEHVGLVNKINDDGDGDDD